MLNVQPTSLVLRGISGADLLRTLFSMPHCERGRETDRQTETEKERQRTRERETERERERETDRHRERERKRERPCYLTKSQFI